MDSFTATPCCGYLLPHKHPTPIGKGAGMTWEDAVADSLNTVLARVSTGCCGVWIRGHPRDPIGLGVTLVGEDDLLEGARR
jgi:hypothetical protein